MKNILAKLIGTSFGSGYGPVAPGTFGTLFGIGIYVLLAQGYPKPESILIGDIDRILICMIILFTILGTWSAKVLEPEWGHDPGKIVIDECIGVWITVLFIPLSWLNVLLAFILFRFFDILKPLGISEIDKKMGTPFSVMLDDIVAGVYSAIVLQGILFLI
ncbi:MAG: phosphatidylglycerophosphatase A [Saprospiraceae bacterium]